VVLLVSVAEVPTPGVLGLGVDGAELMLVVEVVLRSVLYWSAVPPSCLHPINANAVHRSRIDFFIN
jgi:hypothetical protein